MSENNGAAAGVVPGRPRLSLMLKKRPPSSTAAGEASEAKRPRPLADARQTTLPAAWRTTVALSSSNASAEADAAAGDVKLEAVGPPTPPGTPAGWIAEAAQLTADGLALEAVAVLTQVRRRLITDLPLLICADFATTCHAVAARSAQAVAQRPDAAELWLARARLHADAQRLSDALSDALRAVQLAKTEPSVRPVVRGDTLDTSLVMLISAHIAPLAVWIQAYLVAGEALIALRRFTEAEEILDAGLTKAKPTGSQREVGPRAETLDHRIYP